MACYTDYIKLDNLTPSRTGLYLDSLPGIDVETIDGLRKSGDDTDATWNKIYDQAWGNLVSDISAKLQDKFFVDTKLISRETSGFLADYNSSSSAGVKLTFSLTRYSRIHIISVDVYSQSAQVDVPIRLYDTDTNGELLLTVTEDLVAGLNTINVDTDFETNVIMVVIDSATYPVKQTENKYYSGFSIYSPVICEYQYMGGFNNVEQINSGGLNIKYTVTCSIEKFVCENINIFKKAFHWGLGVAVCEWRRYGENLNRFTTMTADRFEELGGFFGDKYEKELNNAIKSQNVRDDHVCFNCKNIVTTQTSIP